MYTPDKWVIIELTPKGGDAIHKVLGSWYGGYATADHWRMNSGIKKITRNGDYYEFHGYSGSKYFCHEKNTGMSMHTLSIAQDYTIRLREQGHSFRLLSDKELQEYLSSNIERGALQA